MPKNWSNAAFSSDGLYVENDFKQALYQIVCSQVLYAKEQNQAVAYALITGYRSEFREAADLLGLRLEFNEPYRYCYVVPCAGKPNLMDTTETLLLLVMRRMYHDKALTGDLEAGEAHVSIDELISAYRASTKRDLPKSAGDIKELILRARRYGVARLGPAPEGDPQPFIVMILPAIADILSDSALGRLGAYQQTAVELTDLGKTSGDAQTNGGADEAA